MTSEDRWDPAWKERDQAGWTPFHIGVYLSRKLASPRLQRLLVDLVLPFLDEDDLDEMYDSLDEFDHERCARVRVLLPAR